MDNKKTKNAIIKPCKYSYVIKKDKKVRVCVILGDKSQTPYYEDGKFIGNLCKVYDKKVCKDRKVR